MIATAVSFWATPLAAVLVIGVVVVSALVFGVRAVKKGAWRE